MFTTRGYGLADLSSYLFYFLEQRKSCVELGRMVGSPFLFLLGDTVATTRQVRAKYGRLQLGGLFF